MVEIVEELLVEVDVELLEVDNVVAVVELEVVELDVVVVDDEVVVVDVVGIFSYRAHIAKDKLSFVFVNDPNGSARPPLVALYPALPPTILP